MIEYAIKNFYAISKIMLSLLVMKKILICITAALAAMLTPSRMYAQRTAEGEMGVYATYTHPFMKGWGASVGWNYYTLFGVWDASVTATSREFVFEKTMPVPVQHYTARGGYLVRALATRDRRVNLYVGGGVILGAGVFKLLHRLDDIEKEYGTTIGRTEFGGNPYFIFGLYPKLECEFFFIDNVAFDLSAQMPVTFHDKDHAMVQKTTKVLYPELSLGIKINF